MLDDAFKQHPHTDYSELSQESSVKAEIDRMIIEAKEPKEQEASELGLTKPSAVFKAPRLVEVPWGSQVEMLVDIAMCKYIYCNFELPEEIPHFEPCYHYRASVAMNAAYEMMLLLPQTIWPEIIDLANQLQPPEVRDEICAYYQQAETRERSWYTCKRQPGVVGFLLPSGYVRNKSYPRIQPYGKEGDNRLGLLGVKREFRNSVLGNFSKAFSQYGGYGIYELDIRSCHTELLAG